MFRDRYKKIIKILLFVFLLSQQIFSQNVDSLFNLLVTLRVEDNNIQSNQFTQDEIIKCGFPLICSIKNNYDKFNQLQVNIIETILSRPSMPYSIVSPSGFFRIHYDTVGVNKVMYNLNDFAKALDSAYNFEVNILGFDPPPSDNGKGGDNKYDVYISNLGRYYGWTVWEDAVGENIYMTYIEVDNDFTGFNTEGINAARVTAAHEFHHAIQIGSYILREELDGDITDLFYYEITSTSMEEFVYPDVNDYIHYVKDYFNYPNKSLYSYSGYELSIFNIFLKERFGIGIIREIWELIKNYRAIEAIALAISARGSSLRYELNLFGGWVYFTNTRAQAGKYFYEAKDYPLVTPTTTIDYLPPQKTVNISSQPISNNFILFRIGTSDTLMAVLANSDIQNGIRHPNSRLSFDYSLHYDSYYYGIFSSTNNYVLSELKIFNDEILSYPAYDSKVVDYAFPQPFIYEKNSFLFLPAPDNLSNFADVNVYDIGMNLIYSSELPIIQGEKLTVQWNGKDEQGNKLSSGIYIYIVKTKENQTKGKIVIFNE
ncbi:MAG: hypothetical protein JXA68_04655 [Ignavibacteriales bacterium]|nr:hypothetical protein [Ignavibacteriales bacterium]